MRSMFVNRRDEQGTREGRLSVFISEECSRSREEKPLWAMENKEEKPHVAKKSDSFSLSVFVLWQNEGPGHTLGGGTSWGVHLRSLRAVLSTGHRQRAREAARFPALRTVRAGGRSTPQSGPATWQSPPGCRTA